MFLRYKKLLQTLTFFLVICLADGYVFAVLPDQKPPADKLPGKALPSGTLDTFGEESVLVNGNAAYNGMTILSSAYIKTGKNSGATINLRQIGRIELCSETSAKLVFTAEQIDLQLLSGQAKLTTYKGVNGVLTAADGKELKTASTLQASSVGSCETTVVDVPASIPTAAAGSFGMGILGTLAVFGGVVGGSVLALFAAQTGNPQERTVSNVQP